MQPRYFFFFLLFLQGFLVLSAQRTSLVFVPLFGNAKVDSAWHPLNNSDSLRINTLRFYLGGFQFLKNDKIVWEEKSSYHLLDASNENSLKLDFELPAKTRFNAVRFLLGVDSLTSVSGAMAAALDPVNGMYWTWNSGYINLKLEGQSNVCSTRNNEFQFHLGGYMHPFNAIQPVNLQLRKKEKNEIYFDLQQIFWEVNLKANNHIMSPSSDAVQLSAMMARNFSTKRK